MVTVLHKNLHETFDALRVSRERRNHWQTLARDQKSRMEELLTPARTVRHSMGIKMIKVEMTANTTVASQNTSMIVLELVTARLYVCFCNDDVVKSLLAAKPASSAQSPTCYALHPLKTKGETELQDAVSRFFLD
ncbi:hypothetical protein RB195_019830 [Necator americanus]|uniref:Uncharacterized protein n=1 Tax=Necator americanus TaxID=51031 RepID=A0ABR1CFZ4_NECAM